MLITSKHLDGDCQNQINLFNETFPVGFEFNKTNWDLALSVGLEVRWMKKLLDVPAWKIYDEAEALSWKMYKEETAPVKKIYDEAIESALKIYDKAKESAQKIRDDTIEPAFKIYNEATAPALEIYNEATKYVLFNALDQQFNGVK